MKELKIYLIILIVIAALWHKDQWLDHPIEQLINLPNGGAFGVPGIAHPFVFTLIIYIIIFILRLPFRKKNLDS